MTYADAAHATYMQLVHSTLTDHEIEDAIVAALVEGGATLAHARRIAREYLDA